MLGISMALSGLLLVLLASIAVKLIGSCPGNTLGVPIVLAWIFGAVWFVLGLLLAIWG